MDIEKAMKNIESVLNKSNEALSKFFTANFLLFNLAKKPNRPES